MEIYYQAEIVPKYVGEDVPFSYIENDEIPHVQLGQKYYTLINGVWEQCIFEMLFYDYFNKAWRFRLETSAGKHYHIKAHHCEVYATKDDLYQYLVGKGKTKIKFESVLYVLQGYAGCPMLDHAFGGLCVRKYTLFDGTPRLSSVDVKCIWVNENGLHYRLHSRQDFYDTIEECAKSVTIHDFDDADVKTEQVFNVKIDLQITAYSMDEAIRKALQSL